MESRFGSLLCIVFILLFTLPSNALALRGDTNCDAAINFDDIDPFIKALSGQAAYETAYPNCQWLNADINNSGSVNFDDIDPFIALLSSCGSNQRPVANAGDDRNAQLDETLTFNGDGSSDPDSANASLAYTWVFPDGSSTSGPITQYTFYEGGKFRVHLTVTDPCGKTDTDSVSVRVLAPDPTNRPPYLKTSPNRKAYVGKPANLFALARDHDGDKITSYEWDFGDSSAHSFTPYTVQHTYNAVGTYTVNLKAWDDYGAEASSSFTVEVLPANSFVADFYVEKMAYKDPVTGTEVWLPVGLAGQELLEPGLKVRLCASEYSNGAVFYRWKQDGVTFSSSSCPEISLGMYTSFNMKLIIYDSSFTQFNSVEKTVTLSSGMTLMSQMGYAPVNFFPQSDGSVLTKGTTLQGAKLWASSTLRHIGVADVSNLNALGTIQQLTTNSVCSSLDGIEISEGPESERLLFASCGPQEFRIYRGDQNNFVLLNTITPQSLGVGGLTDLQYINGVLYVMGSAPSKVFALSVSNVDGSVSVLSSIDSSSVVAMRRLGKRALFVVVDNYHAGVIDISNPNSIHWDGDLIYSAEFIGWQLRSSKNLVLVLSAHGFVLFNYDIPASSALPITLKSKTFIPLEYVYNFDFDEERLFGSYGNGITKYDIVRGATSYPMESCNPSMPMTKDVIVIGPERTDKPGVLVSSSGRGFEARRIR